MLAVDENAYKQNTYKSSEDDMNASDFFNSQKHEVVNQSGTASSHNYSSKDTRWTFQDSNISDPVYIRDDSVTADFVPLPRVQSEYNLSTDARMEEHFIGVRSEKEAAAAVKVDDFALYYKYDSNDHVCPSIPLYLVHRNTKNKIFHFPVVRVDDDNGGQWWHVQIGSNKMQSFRQLSDLVRCYHLYRFTDARTGRMEVFPLWKGGVVDEFE